MRAVTVSLAVAGLIGGPVGLSGGQWRPPEGTQGRPLLPRPRAPAEASESLQWAPRNPSDLGPANGVGVAVYVAPTAGTRASS